MLYPIESEARDVRDLSGIWRFKLDPRGDGRWDAWFSRPLQGTIAMPVPASYNDITQDIAVRDHVGDAWYERSFTVSPGLIGRRVVLWFGSAAHAAKVWLNGKEVMEHAGACLSFEAEVTDLLDPAVANRLTVVGELFDVVCVNEYHGWYLETSRLELIEQRLRRELQEIRRKYQKPIIVSEFGAEALAGLHRYPPVMFAEEYQCEFLERYFRVFDELPFVVGEHVWCFADFATKQELSRVAGNRKGVLTRQRDPKAAAHLLRKRWTADRPPR